MEYAKVLNIFVDDFRIVKRINVEFQIKKILFSKNKTDLSIFFFQ